MAYASAEDVSKGFRTLTDDEKAAAEALLDEAAAIIDSYAKDAGEAAKKVVSCRMVRRAIGSGGDAFVPMGATQGTVSAMGYSQSWTVSDGASGELYIGKQEKKILGVGDRIGVFNPLEDIDD